MMKRNFILPKIMFKDIYQHSVKHRQSAQYNDLKNKMVFYLLPNHSAGYYFSASDS
ncbi:Uncharacterised protein [Serratia quinivorans]|nr:Uncharacterised protein [Serratia quinivorans]